MPEDKLRLNLYGVHIHCLFEGPALYERAREALLPFLDSTAPPDHVVEAREKTIRVDGNTVKGVPRAASLFIEGFFSQLSALFWREVREFLVLHAGAVRKEGKVVLFPGFSGSGKSTLVAWHLQHGWEYLGDDLTCISFQDKGVFPYPLPLKLAHPPESLLAALEKVPAMRVHKASYQKKARYLIHPAQVFPGTAGADTPVALVFPGFFPGEALSLTPLTRQETFRALVPHCLNFSSHPREVFDALTWLVEKAHGHELICGNFDQLEEGLRALGGAGQCRCSA
jgi:hypothetical protein